MQYELVVNVHVSLRVTIIGRAEEPEGFLWRTLRIQLYVVYIMYTTEPQYGDLILRVFLGHG